MVPKGWFKTQKLGVVVRGQKFTFWVDWGDGEWGRELAVKRMEVLGG